MRLLIAAAVLALLLFWSLIGSDIALTAACLPSLRLLFGQLSVESMVHSVRSVLSLSSLRSTKSHDDKTQEIGGDKYSTSSQRHLAALTGEVALETHDTREDVDMLPLDPLPKGQIIVRNSVSQEEDRV